MLKDTTEVVMYKNATKQFYRIINNMIRLLNISNFLLIYILEIFKKCDKFYNIQYKKSALLLCRICHSVRKNTLKLKFL